MLERRFARTREPVAAARLYLDHLVREARGLRAAVVIDNGRVVAGAGMPAADLAQVARAAEDQDASVAPKPSLRGDLFIHRILVRGRRHVFATLGGRARRVRDVERDLARILGA
jgi:hypothetical protein